MKQKSEPEPAAMPEGTAGKVLCVDHTGKWMCWLRLSDLREALATKGLSIVGPEERKVLEGMQHTDSHVLQKTVDWLRGRFNGGWRLLESLDAELARRAKKGEKT